MTLAALLIVNADDLGLSTGVNAGIFQAHDRGIVTSASLMTRWPAAAAAAAGARSRPKLGVGLHVDLGEWHHNGQDWEKLYEVVSLEDAGAVEREILRQLQSFRELMGRDPDHLDSHQHVHRREPVKGVMHSLAHELDAPLRHFSPARYCGEFYGQTDQGASLGELVSASALVSLLGGIRPGEAVELCCHPAQQDDLESLGTMYHRERLMELQALCDPSVRRAAAQEPLRLGTFRSLKEHA